MKKETHTAIKQQLIIAGKVLVAEGQDDFTRGHISVRVPGNPKLFFMKAHSLGLDEITMQNILTIDLEGNVVAGSARRHSEVYIHSEIFKARADVNCVIHTHPTYSVAFSGTGHPMKAYSQPGAMFSGEVGVYTDTITLIRSHALGAGVAKALGSRRAVLLKNHGPVVTGKTIEEAVVSRSCWKTPRRFSSWSKPPARRRRSSRPTISPSSRTKSASPSSSRSISIIWRAG